MLFFLLVFFPLHHSLQCLLRHQICEFLLEEEEEEEEEGEGEDGAEAVGGR